MQNETHTIKTDSLPTDQILYQRFKQEFSININNEEPIIIVQQKQQLNQNAEVKKLLENFINLDINIEEKIQKQANPAQEANQNSTEQFKRQKKFIPQIQILNQKQQPKQKNSVSEYSLFYNEFYDPIISNSSFTARNQISETQRKSYLSIPVNQWSLALLQQNYSRLQNSNITVDKKFVKSISFEIKHSTVNAKIMQIQVRLSYFVFVIKLANLQKSFNQYSKNLLQIGYGSYGVIYGYFDEQLGKNIALKQIKISQSLAQLNERRQYSIKPFLLEYCVYKLLSVLKLGLQIPNIFGFDAICFEDSMIFPMEYAMSIFKLKNKQVKNLNPNFVENLIQSLYFLHSFHIIHQDIKPNNVMYSTANNKIVLIDFGISDVIDQKVGQKTWTNFVGTYQYCSQEMRKLFYSKNSHPIDLYWNDTVGLRSTLNFITQKVLFIKKYQSAGNSSVQSQVWSINCQERMLLDSQDFLNEQQEKMNDLKAHETLIQQHKKKAQKKSSFKLFIILKVIYNLYTQNDENIKKILSSNKQIIHRRKTSQMIADYMLDISPSIKLFKIFIQYFYPLWSTGFTSSVEINSILDIYKDVNVLSAAKLPYFSEIENLFLVRYNLAYEQTNKTKKSTQVSKFNEIMSQQLNQNKYINFMNILIWLESLNFYEQEENFISQIQILKAVKEIAKNIFGTSHCEQKLPLLLVRVLQYIWNQTQEYLRFYSDIEYFPQKDQNQTANENKNFKQQRFFYKNLKNDSIEHKKYENSKRKVKQQAEKQQNKVNPKQLLQVYELNFIMEFLPEILFKICKIYERLQLFKRFIIKIKLYSLFTRDFNRLIMTFYYIVKYSYMNFHQQYDLQYIIKDMNFMFSLNHKNIIPKIVQSYQNKIIKQAQITKRKAEEDKSFSKFNKSSQQKNQEIKKDPKVTFFAFQVVLKDLQSIPKSAQYQNLNEKYFSENGIVNEENFQIQQSEPKQMSVIDFIEKIDISQKCKGEMKFDKLKALDKNQANNIQLPNQNSLLCQNEQNHIKQWNYLNLDSLKKEQIEQHVFEGYIDLDSKLEHKNEERNRQAFNLILEKIKSKGKEKLKKQKQLKSTKNHSSRGDLFERVINGQPGQFVNESKMDKGFDYIEMIINVLLGNAKELSLYNSNLFKLILMVLRDIFMEITKAQAYHVGNKPSLTIKDPQKMKQISKTIIFYIKYISSEQCWIQKLYKDQILGDLTISLFQCALFGQIKQLVENCEEFIGNKSKIRITDTKKQEFFLLIAAKYQMVFLQDKKKKCLWHEVQIQLSTVGNEGSQAAELQVNTGVRIEAIMQVTQLFYSVVQSQTITLIFKQQTETLLTQSCFLDCCLLHDQFELLYRHLILLIQLMARFRPFRNVMATNVALRIMQKFFEITGTDNEHRFAKMISFGHFIIQKRNNIVQHSHNYESHINPYSMYFHMLLSRNILQHSSEFVFFEPQRNPIAEQLTKFRKHFLTCVNDLRNFYNMEGVSEASRDQVKNDKGSKSKTQKQQTNQANTQSSGIQITLVAKEFQLSLKDLCRQFCFKFNFNKLKKLSQNPKIPFVTKVHSLTRNDYLFINQNIGNQTFFYQKQLKHSTQAYIISRLKVKVIKKQLNSTF